MTASGGPASGASANAPFANAPFANAPSVTGASATARSATGASATGASATGASATAASAPAAPYDPLRLCVYATIAALAWLLGPVAVAGFALLGFAGYVRARRRGLTRSKCVLRDTRLVLAYLGVLALAGAAGIAWQIYRLVT